MVAMLARGPAVERCSRCGNWPLGYTAAHFLGLRFRLDAFFLRFLSCFFDVVH